MHPNPAFRDTPTEANIAFARERGFGVLAVNGPDGPLMSHVPFLLCENGNHADLHLVRSNPISRAGSEPLQARLAVSGPDSYVSPDWYNAEDQVPTWNYVAVHLAGSLMPLPEQELPDLLDRLSTYFEEQLLPKPVWLQSKVDSETLARLMRMIRPFRLVIADVQGTWKVSQNKTDTMRLSAADQVAAFGIGSEPHLMAALMQSPTGKTSE